MSFDIESIKRKMLVKYPFFGSVVANVDYKGNTNIPTAGTDGETIYYNPNFLEKLSVEEQTFIFAHEICHIAFNHILRSEGKDPAIWNTATATKSRKSISTTKWTTRSARTVTTKSKWSRRNFREWKFKRLCQ